MEKVTTQFASNLEDSPAGKLLSYLTSAEAQTQSNEDNDEFENIGEANRQLNQIIQQQKENEPISPVPKLEPIKLKEFRFPQKRKVTKKEQVSSISFTRETSPKETKKKATKLESHTLIPGSLPLPFKNPNLRAHHHYGGTQSRKSWRGSDIPSPRSPSPAQSPAMSAGSNDKQPSSKYRRNVNVQLHVEMAHSQSKGSQLGLINSANHSELKQPGSRHLNFPDGLDAESSHLNTNFDDPDRQFVGAEYTAQHYFAAAIGRPQMNADIAMVNPQFGPVSYLSAKGKVRQTFQPLPNTHDDDLEDQRLTPQQHDSLYLRQSMEPSIAQSIESSDKQRVAVAPVYSKHDSVHNPTLHTQTGDESPLKDSRCNLAHFDLVTPKTTGLSRSELLSVEIPNQIKVNQSQYERRPVQLRTSRDNLKMPSESRSEDTDRPQLTAIRSESKSFATQMAETPEKRRERPNHHKQKVISQEVKLKTERQRTYEFNTVQLSSRVRESHDVPETEKVPSEQLETIQSSKNIRHKSSIKVDLGEHNESSLVLFKQFQGDTGDLPSMDSDLSQLNQQASLAYSTDDQQLVSYQVNTQTQTVRDDDFSSQKKSHKDLGILEQSIAPLKPFQSAPKEPEPVITWVDYFIKPPTPIKESSLSGVSSSARNSPERQATPEDTDSQERYKNISPTMARFVEQFQGEGDQFKLGLEMQARYGASVTNVKVLKLNEEFLKKAGHFSILNDKGRKKKTWQQSAAEMMYLIQRRQAPKLHLTNLNWSGDSQVSQKKDEPEWQQRINSIRRSERESKLVRKLYQKKKASEMHSWKSSTVPSPSPNRLISPEPIKEESNNNLHVLNACEPTPINQQQLLTNENPLVCGRPIAPSIRYTYAPEAVKTMNISVEQTCSSSRSSDQRISERSSDKLTVDQKKENEWIKVVFEDQKKSQTAIPGTRQKKPNPFLKVTTSPVQDIIPAVAKQQTLTINSVVTVKEQQAKRRQNFQHREQTELEPSRTDRTNSSISQRTIKLSPDKYHKMRKSKNRPINQDLDLSSDSGGNESQERHAASGVSLHMSARIYSKVTAEKKPKSNMPVVKMAVPMSRVTSREKTTSRKTMHSHQEDCVSNRTSRSPVVPKTPDQIKISSKPNSQSRNYASRNSKYVSEERGTIQNASSVERQADTPNESVDAQNLSETRLGSVIVASSNNDLDKVASAVNVEASDAKLIPRTQPRTHELSWLLRNNFNNPYTTGLVERIANKRTMHIAKTFLSHVPESFANNDQQEVSEETAGVQTIRSRHIGSGGANTRKNSAKSHSSYANESFDKQLVDISPKKHISRAFQHAKKTPMSHITDSQKKPQVTITDDADDIPPEAPSTPFVLNSNKGSMVSNRSISGRKSPSPGEKTPEACKKEGRQSQSPILSNQPERQSSQGGNPLKKNQAALKQFKSTAIAQIHVAHAANVANSYEAPPPLPLVTPQSPSFYTTGKGGIAPIVVKSKDFQQLEASRQIDAALQKEFEFQHSKLASERFHARKPRTKHRLTGHNFKFHQKLATDRSSQQRMINERANHSSNSSRQSGQSDGALSLVIQNVLGNDTFSPSARNPNQVINVQRKPYSKVNTKSAFAMATYPRRIVKMRGTQVVVNHLTSSAHMSRIVSPNDSSQSLNQSSQFAVLQQMPGTRFMKPNTPAATMGTRLRRWFPGIQTSQESAATLSDAENSIFKSELTPRRDIEEAPWFKSPESCRESNQSNQQKMNGRPKFDFLQFQSAERSTKRHFVPPPVLKQPQQMQAYLAMQKAQFQRLSKHNFIPPSTQHNTSVSAPRSKPSSLKPKVTSSLHLGQQSKTISNRSRRNKLYDTAGIRVENTSKATSGSEMLTPDFKKDEEIQLQSKYHVLVMNSEEDGGTRSRQVRSGL